ncbi:hypothetical protein BDZ89DRAFT_1149695 [Hymenopellis radicata]|nr:hypothetical protein BDZ89DRAFT_1149695 [Hymenopellis radicata]
MRISGRTVTVDALRCHQHFEPSPADLPSFGAQESSPPHPYLTLSLSLSPCLLFLIVSTLSITPHIFRSTSMAQHVCRTSSTIILLGRHARYASCFVSFLSVSLFSMPNTISFVAWLLPIALIDYQLRRQSHRRDRNFLTRPTTTTRGSCDYDGHTPRLP